MSSSLHYFKALADETRLRLLHILARYELNVNELVLLLAMGQSRVSRHLKILTSAGLLTSRRDGLWVFYSIPESGAGRDFINAILPFSAENALMRADVEMAVALIEERANKTHQFFNSIADDWDRLTNEILDGFDLPAAVLENMPQCKVACDLGCGTGVVLEKMKSKARSVIGVDGSARMLELAKRRFLPEDDSVSLRIGDLCHLPLRDAETDFASVNMVLHHLPSPVDVLKEVRRVLTPKGTLVITDFNSHTDERMRTDYGDRWLGFSEETLRAYLERAGFDSITIKTIPLKKNLSLHILTAANPAASLEAIHGNS